MKEYLQAFFEYQDQVFWEHDIDDLDKRLEMWFDSDECKALHIHVVSVMLPSDGKITKHVNTLDTPQGCDQFSIDTGFVKGAIYMRELAKKQLIGN